MVTVIHPSRSRPSQAQKTAKNWIKKIGLPQSDFEYVLSLDHDDPQLGSYQMMDRLCENFIKIITDNKSAIEAINIASQLRSHNKKRGDFLIVISDDFECAENWGSRIVKMMGDKNDWILKTQDGIQNWIITLPIMDWDYYNRFGYVYHPSYQHAFCDTEMTCVAHLTGRVGVSMLKFNHNHYSVGGLTKDELYERNDATFESGKKIFIERKKRNFDLKLKDLKGQLTDNVYTRMN